VFGIVPSDAIDPVYGKRCPVPVISTLGIWGGRKTNSVEGAVIALLQAGADSSVAVDYLP